MIRAGLLSAGEASSGKQRSGELSILLLNTDSFASMMGHLVKCFGSPGLSMIYGMGRESGVNDVKQIREDLSYLKTPTEKQMLIEKALQRATHMGWGQISLSEFDEVTGVVNVEIGRNPFSDKCGSRDAGGCFYLHGYMAGVVSEVMEVEMEYGSPRCLDISDEKCILRLVRPVKASHMPLGSAAEAVSSPDSS